MKEGPSFFYSLITPDVRKPSQTNSRPVSEYWARAVSPEIKCRALNRMAGDVDTSDYLASALDKRWRINAKTRHSTVEQKDLPTTLFGQSSLDFLSQSRFLDILMRHRPYNSNFRQLETINIINSRQRIQANKRHQSQIDRTKIVIHAWQVVMRLEYSPKLVACEG